MEILETHEDQMIAELTSIIFDLMPGMDVDLVRNKFSNVVSNYQVVKMEEYSDTPDLQEKIFLYLAAIKLEGYSPLTLKGYRIELKVFSREVNKKVSDISTSDIRNYLALSPHLKKSTIGSKLTVLKSFFAWLLTEGYTQYNPAAKIKTPKIPKLKSKSLDIEELEMLRESCKTRRQRAFLEVFYATGCRINEIYKLNKDDIDLQEMSSNVIGKGNKEREVYLSYRAMFHLKQYLDSRKDDCPALFVTERRPIRRLTESGILREVKKIAGYAGLGHKVSPHILRHTFATLTLNNGADLTAVQELLGHASPHTTLRYARISDARKREQHRKYLVM